MEKPWFKLYPPHVPHSIDYPVKPLYENLRDSARKFPDRVAIIHRGVEYTYSELNKLAERFATALYNFGIQKGDRVAIYLPNIPQFIVSYYGTMMAGGVVVACNAMYREKELAHQVNDSGARIIITLDELYPVVKNIKEMTSLEEIIVTGRGDLLPPLLSLSGKTDPPDGTHDMVQLISKHLPDPPDIPIDPKEDLAVLQYTGGTTGVPKGAMLTHYNLLVDQVQEMVWWNAKEGQEVAIIFLPVSHIYGMNWCMNAHIYVGGTIVLIERFDPTEVLKAVNKFRPTFFYGVATAYIAFLDHPEIDETDFSSVKVCFSAAAPLPPEVKRRWKEVTGVDIIEAWGLTEASPCLTCTPLGMVREKLIGIPIPDTEVKVVDVDTGEEELKPGEVGELIGKGPQIMKGYWNKPEETEKAIRNGWLYTGDLGYMDEEGCFYFVDRKKDMINVSGYKVWPDEVENVLYGHPAIKEVAVVSSPDTYRGEVPKAFVVLREDFKGKVTEKDIIKFCKDKLAAYKVPRAVEIRDDLPKTPVGKILRRVLRDQEWHQSK
jgi:long-chain acyl-CoA synthetase